MDPSSGRVTNAYRYNISGWLGGGLAVDQQGYVYICGADDIHRLSPDGTFRDIVLSEHDGVDRPRGITFFIYKI
jgi:sugar lactone lactonase YvrE